MSRLDSFIRRMTAQRDCLNHVARLVADLPGPVLEVGLGNGRTYDHLREILPARQIFVFDRRVAAHPDCIPDDAHLLLGDVRDTLVAARGVLPAPAALAHCDIGTGDAAANAELVRTVGPLLDALMAPGGIVLSDQCYAGTGWTPLPLPDGVREGRYFISRVG